MLGVRHPILKTATLNYIPVSSIIKKFRFVVKTNNFHRRDENVYIFSYNLDIRYQVVQTWSWHCQGCLQIRQNKIHLKTVPKTPDSYNSSIYLSFAPQSLSFRPWWFQIRLSEPYCGPGLELPPTLLLTDANVWDDIFHNACVTYDEAFRLSDRLWPRAQNTRKKPIKDKRNINSYLKVWPVRPVQFGSVQYGTHGVTETQDNVSLW